MSIYEMYNEFGPMGREIYILVENGDSEQAPAARAYTQPRLPPLRLASKARPSDQALH